MLGNPSIPAITLSVMALHSTILTPRNVVAEDASSATDENYYRYRRRTQRKKRRRRQAGSIERLEQKSWQQRDQFRHIILEESAAAATKEHGQSPISIRSIDLDDGPSRQLKSCIGWHAEMTNQDGCSDDANYPDAWLEEKRSMFHTSYESCCKSFYNGSGGCKKYDTSSCAFRSACVGIFIFVQVASGYQKPRWMC